jgi:hypothetical protein
MNEPSDTQNIPSPPGISTEILPIQEIVVERKHIYSVGYKKRNRKSISTNEHPTTIRKKQGKRKLLEIMNKGGIPALCYCYLAHDNGLQVTHNGLQMASRGP